MQSFLFVNAQGVISDTGSTQLKGVVSWVVGVVFSVEKTPLPMETNWNTGLELYSVCQLTLFLSIFTLNKMKNSSETKGCFMQFKLNGHLKVLNLN